MQTSFYVDKQNVNNMVIARAKWRETPYYVRGVFLPNDTELFDPWVAKAEQALVLMAEKRTSRTLINVLKVRSERIRKMVRSLERTVDLGYSAERFDNDIIISRVFAMAFRQTPPLIYEVKSHVRNWFATEVTIRFGNGLYDL